MAGLLFLGLAFIIYLILKTPPRAQRRTEVRFVKLSPEAMLPQRSHDDDIGYDLRATEGCTLWPGEHQAIGTGLAVHLPNEVAGFVVPRSGLAAKHAITIVNSPGLIDPGYRGEIKVVLQNTSKKTFHVSVGDRIAQFVFISTLPVILLEEADLGESSRGTGGLGSTGK